MPKCVRYTASKKDNFPLITFSGNLYVVQGLLTNLCSKMIKEKEKWQG